MPEKEAVTVEQDQEQWHISGSEETAALLPAAKDLLWPFTYL